MASKYYKGSKIENLDQFDCRVANGGMIQWRYKVYHPGFLISWPYRSITNEIKNGRFFKAEKIRR